MIPIPRCRVVVAPSDGRLLHALPDRTPVRPGDVIARLEMRGRTHELTAPVAGRVGGAMVGATHPVTAGDGVVWLDVA